MKCAQHAAHNPKLEKMGLFRQPGGGTNRLKDPPTWLKVTTTYEKTTPTHPAYYRISWIVNKYTYRLIKADTQRTPFWRRHLKCIFIVIIMVLCLKFHGVMLPWIVVSYVPISHLWFMWWLAAEKRQAPRKISYLIYISLPFISKSPG